MVCVWAPRCRCNCRVRCSRAHNPGSSRVAQIRGYTHTGGPCLCPVETPCTPHSHCSRCHTPSHTPPQQTHLGTYKPQWFYLLSCTVGWFYWRTAPGTRLDPNTLADTFWSSLCQNILGCIGIHSGKSYWKENQRGAGTSRFRCKLVHYTDHRRRAAGKRELTRTH